MEGGQLEHLRAHTLPHHRLLTRGSLRSANIYRAATPRTPPQRFRTGMEDNACRACGHAYALHGCATVSTLRLYHSTTATLFALFATPSRTHHAPPWARSGARADHHRARHRTGIAAKTSPAGAGSYAQKTSIASPLNITVPPVAGGEKKKKSAYITGNDKPCGRPSLRSVATQTARLGCLPAALYGCLNFARHTAFHAGSAARATRVG